MGSERKIASEERLCTSDQRGEKEIRSTAVSTLKPLRLELHGARTASDAGLVARGEFSGPIESTEVAPNYLRETRGGRNVQRKLMPLLCLSVYSRLAGYKDANDAEGVASDPATQASV